MDENNDIGAAVPKVQTPPPEPMQDAPPKPKRVRRVGTCTMGLSLIIIGVTICLSMFVPSVDMLMLAKLAPLVLVALGIEIVITSCFAKQDTIKYDGLSIFIAMILIGFSMCAAFFPTVLEYIGPNAGKAQANISAQISDEMYLARAQMPKISDVRVSVNNNVMRRYTGDEDISSLMLGDEVYAYVVLNDSYTDKIAFAKDADVVYDMLCKIVPCNVRMGIMSAKSGHASYFEAEIYGKFNSDLTPEERAKSVLTMVYHEDNYYREDELERILKNEADTEAEKLAQEQYNVDMERIAQMEQEAQSRIVAAEEESQRRIEDMENEANQRAQEAIDNAANEAQRMLDEAKGGNQ